MSFKIEIKDDVTIVRITKPRLDTNITPELKTELLVIVDQGVKKILVDLDKVSYADSSGLGALLFGLRQIRDQEGTLVTFGANSRIQNLLRIAKLDEILLNYENESSALKSLKA